MSEFQNHVDQLSKRLSIDDLKHARENLQAFMRTDNWKNTITNLGVQDKDHRLNTRFTAGRVITRQEYEALYIEDPIFARIVDGVPEHGTRRWVKVTAVDTRDEDGTEELEEDFSQEVMGALEDLDAQDKFFDLWRLARLDGGAVMVMSADDGLDPDKPLDLGRLRSLDALNVVSRFEIFPSEINQDITSPFFKEPEFYQFSGTLSSRFEQPGDARDQKAAGQRKSRNKTALRGKIHRSRVIRMQGIRLSESPVRQQATLQDPNWGTPIIQRVYDDLRQYNTIFGYVEAGFKDMSQGVFGMKNLSELLSIMDTNEDLIARMTLIGLAASTFNMVLFDPDTETYEKKHAQFSGVDSVLMRFMEKLAAAAEQPLTKLFGLTPAGLSTDDEAGDRTFNASIAAKQRRKLRKPINRVVETLLNASDGPTNGKVPEKWKVQFLPLEEPNEKEEADRRKTDSETDTINLSNGTLELHEARTRIRNDPDQPYTLDAAVDEAIKVAGEPIDPAEAARMAAELQLPQPDPEADPTLPPNVNPPPKPPSDG